MEKPEEKAYLRINFGYLLRFLADAPKNNEVKIKFVLYDSKCYVKGWLVVKDFEQQFAFDGLGPKKCHDEQEMIEILCKKKFLETIGGVRN